jgi:hypothetical protein
MCSMLTREVGLRTTAGEGAKSNIARERGLPRLTLLAACLLGFAAVFGQLSVAAAQVTWNNPKVYDGNGGFNPSVAVSGSTVVEVHVATAALGPLWYRLGQVGSSDITWRGSLPVNVTGFNPSVAVSGSTVVVMYNTGAGAGPLRYLVGRILGSAGIWWSDPQSHDTGFNPSVAMMSDMSESIVVEVHNATDAAGPLWSRVGKVTGSTIAWGPPQHYGSGFNPSVAVSGSTVVEMHNATAAAGQLLHYVAPIIAQSKVINWASSFPFSPQLATSSLIDPSVAVSGSTVIALYSGPDAAGIRPLLYHVGEITSLPDSPPISWGHGDWIGGGSNPSVAIVVPSVSLLDGPTAIAVHNETNAASRLLYQVGSFATEIRTFVVKPSDVSTAYQGQHRIGPFCTISSIGLPGPEPLPSGQTKVGFWDAYYHCPEKWERIYRGSVGFDDNDLSKFNSIIDARMGFDILNRDRADGTGSGPPCAATKLGMSTGFTQSDQARYLWDLDHEVPLPADCPTTIEVTSQVQAWINKSHHNFGFILAGPRMVFNDDLPTDNDRNLTIYGNFQLKILYDRLRNPRAPQ